MTRSEIAKKPRALMTSDHWTQLPESGRESADWHRGPVRPFDGTFAEAKALFERGYIERLLRAHEGNVSRAADASGRSRRWFRDLMEKHGIDAADFKPESR